MYMTVKKIKRILMILLLFCCFFPTFIKANTKCLYFVRDSGNHTRYIVINDDKGYYSLNLSTKNTLELGGLFESENVDALILDNYNDDDFAALIRNWSLTSEGVCPKYAYFTRAYETALMSILYTQYVSIESAINEIRYNYPGIKLSNTANLYNKDEDETYVLLTRTEGSPAITFQAKDYNFEIYSVDKIGVKSAKYGRSRTSANYVSSTEPGNRNLLCLTNYGLEFDCNWIYFKSTKVGDASNITTGLSFSRDGIITNIFTNEQELCKIQTRVQDGNTYQGNDMIKHINGKCKSNISGNIVPHAQLCEIKNENSTATEYMLVFTEKNCADYFKELREKSQPNGDLEPHDYESCEELLGTNVVKFINTVFGILKIAALIATLLLSSYEFLIAIPTENAEAIKKAKKNLITRIVLILVLFALPTLINVVLKMFASFSGFGADNFTCGIK